MRIDHGSTGHHGGERVSLQLHTESILLVHLKYIDDLFLRTAGSPLIFSYRNAIIFVVSSLGPLRFLL